MVKSGKKKTEKVRRTFEENLSVTRMNELKKFSKFDGINSAPSARVIKDTFHSSHGLLLKLSANGKMTFLVHGRIAKSKASAQYYTIGNARDIYLHTARKIAAKYKTFMAEGRHPVEAHRKANRKFTLLQFFDDYLSVRGEKSASNPDGLQPDTINEYNKHFDRLSKKLIKKDALKITREEILKEHNKIAQKYTPFMADKTMHLVNALYNNARPRYINEEDNSEYVKSNPVQILNIDNAWKVNNGQSRRKRECIDTEDMPAVLGALESLETYVDGVKHKHAVSPSAVVCSHFFRLLLFTGWRPEETVKLRWEQVSEDFKDVTWDDQEAAKDLKGAEEQYRFPLNKQATEVLMCLKQYNFNSHWVFPANQLSTHISNNPTHYVDALQNLIGNGKRYTCGIYRKTFQTYGEECDLSSTTIKRLVFHTQKVYDVQSGYIASNRESLRRKSQKVADYILLQANKVNDQKSKSIEVKGDILVKAIEHSKHLGISEQELLNKWLELGMKFDLINN